MHLIYSDPQKSLIPVKVYQVEYYHIFLYTKVVYKIYNFSYYYLYYG